MINLVDFKEKLNATTAKCSSTEDIHGFRCFLAVNLSVLREGNEGNPTKVELFSIASITDGK